MPLRDLPWNMRAAHSEMSCSMHLGSESCSEQNRVLLFLSVFFFCRRRRLSGTFNVCLSSCHSCGIHVTFGEVTSISACPLRTVYCLVKGCSCFQLQTYLGLSPAVPSLSAESTVPQHVAASCGRKVPCSGCWLGVGWVKGSSKPFSGRQAAPWLASLL